MKKIMMTMAAALMAVTMQAQVFVGGGLGFQTTSYDGDSQTTFTILPEVGYTLDDNWAIGMQFGYGEAYNDDVKLKVVTANPYARYTFAHFDKVNLFVDGGFGFTNTDLDAYKVNTWNVGLKPGVAVNLNDRLSFVAHVGFFGYETSKPDYSGAKSVNTFGLSLDGSDLSFGLYYNF